MSEHDRDLTDEQITDVLSRTKPRIVWGRVRDRQAGGRRQIDAQGGSVPATPNGLRDLRRELVGGPGGPPSGIGLTWERLVEAVRDCSGDPTQQVVAEELRASVRHVQRVAATGGGWRRVLEAAGRS